MASWLPTVSGFTQYIYIYIYIRSFQNFVSKSTASATLTATATAKKLPSVTKSCHQLPKVAISCQKLPSVSKKCHQFSKVAKSIHYTPILWDNKYKHEYPDNILGEKVRNWVPTFLTILHKLLLWWDDEITVLNFGWYSIVFKRGERWEIWQWVGYIWQQLALVPKRFVLPRVPAPFSHPATGYQREILQAIMCCLCEG